MSTCPLIRRLGLRLISTYYDTPDLALKRRGVSLRIREQGGRFIQTVKTGDPSSGDVLTRGEWEDELAESRPDPGASQKSAHPPDWYCRRSAAGRRRNRSSSPLAKVGHCV